jgi:hypothetical protein
MAARLKRSGNCRRQLKEEDMTKSTPRDQLITRTDKAGIALTEEELDLVVGGDKYLSYTLSNTMLSGYSMSSGGDAPTETVSLR